MNNQETVRLLKILTTEVFFLCIRRKVRTFSPDAEFCTVPNKPLLLQSVLKKIEVVSGLNKG